MGIGFSNGAARHDVLLRLAILSWRELKRWVNAADETHKVKNETSFAQDCSS